ncbi:hypothetical protein LCM19_02580 [Qipengyuania flava]|nr:hypothetical protein [Qipengyuania flava]
MLGQGLIWFALALSVFGIVILRVSWGRTGRYSTLNALGWGTVILAVLAAGSHSGAWGIANVSLCAMAAAGVFLLLDAAKPLAKRKKSAPKARSLPAARRSAGKALATFLIAGPLSLLASLVIALALRDLIAATGGSQANANVTVLAFVPLAWPLLSFAVLTMRSRMRQFAWLSAPALACLPLVLVQGAVV